MLTKPNILRLVFFVAAFAAALYYPVNRVLSFERPKEKPVEMRFPVRAYDPYDPMRGHYLQLSFDTRLKLPKGECEWMAPRDGVRRRPQALAVLETGPDGNARVTGFAPLDAPPAGKPFVRLPYYYAFKDKKDDGLHVSFRLPFDRYFINEKLAPDAEVLIGNITRGKKHSAVLVVNVYADGRHAVKDLLVDGRPLLTHLRPAAAK